MLKELEMEQDKKLVAKAKAISTVALSTLGLKTLDAQNSDQLDFHDLSVGSIRSALDAAYEFGYRDGSNQSSKQ